MPRANVEVTKNQNETNASLLRRFTKRLQESRVLFRVKKNRFFTRPQSKLKRKEAAIKRIAKRKAVEKLKKLGKL